MANTCFPTRPPINPLRLSADYRDYYGDPHAVFSELLDPILNAGCYIPRIMHAPDSPQEFAGLIGNGYLDYAMVMPAGSWILGFIHSYTNAASTNGTDPPVKSSFRFQLTDVQTDYKFFNRPVPEAYLLNDLPSSNALAPWGVAPLVVPVQSIRLLAAPYPVVPPGIFKLEFWNMLATTNMGVRLSVVIAEPDPDQGAA